MTVMDDDPKTAHIVRVDPAFARIIDATGPFTPRPPDAPAAQKDRGPSRKAYYWIRCRLSQGHYEIVPRISSIRLNIIAAVQVETVRNENLGDGSGLPGHTVTVHKPPMYQDDAVIQVTGRQGEWETWSRVDDFTHSGPDDRHYTLDALLGEIVFRDVRVPRNNAKHPRRRQDPRFSRVQLGLGDIIRVPERRRIGRGALEGSRHVIRPNDLEHATWSPVRDHQWLAIQQSLHEPPHAQGAVISPYDNRWPQHGPRNRAVIDGVFCFTLPVGIRMPEPWMECIRRVDRHAPRQVGLVLSKRSPNIAIRIHGHRTG